MQTINLWTEWSYEEAVEMIKSPEWFMLDNTYLNYWNINNGCLLKLEYNQFNKFEEGKAFLFSPESSLNGYI